MSRNFVFKRTSQFTAQEREDFLGLFARVFNKRLDPEQLDRKYLMTPTGYSHHGLMLAEGGVVGAYNLIPYRYNCFGEQRLFGLSVDAMVAKEHRGGPFNLVKLAKLTYENAKTDGVSFVFGFPNDEAYRFTTRVLRWRDIGELDFYALPINIGAIRPAWRWANGLSRVFAAVFMRLPHLLRPEVPTLGVEKICDACFESHRYDQRHQTITLKDGGTCRYCLHTEDDGTSVAYILDVTPLTPACFAEAVRQTYAVAVGSADMLLYVGKLPFKPAGLIRVPRTKQPRRIRMCGKILEPELVDERVLSIANWNVNISNFDVR